MVDFGNFSDNKQ